MSFMLTKVITYFANLEEKLIFKMILMALIFFPQCSKSECHLQADEASSVEKDTSLFRFYTHSNHVFMNNFFIACPVHSAGI